MTILIRRNNYKFKTFRQQKTSLLRTQYKIFVNKYNSPNRVKLQTSNVQEEEENLMI